MQGDGLDNGDDFGDSLELRSEVLLNKLRLAMMSNSSQNTNTDAEATASSSSSSHSSSSPKTRPLFPEKEGGGTAAAPSLNVLPQLPNTRASTSPTASIRSLSSDDLFRQFQFTFQGQQPQPTQQLQQQQQQQQVLPQHQLNQMPPIASSTSALEPQNNFYSSSILPHFLDSNEIIFTNENAKLKTAQNEFGSKLQEPSMLQQHLRQQGESQMQQFLLQQLDQQPMPKMHHHKQKQQQRLPTDGKFSFKDFITDSCKNSLQSTPSHHHVRNSNSVHFPQQEKISGSVSHATHLQAAVPSIPPPRASLLTASKKAIANPKKAISAPRKAKATKTKTKPTPQSSFQYVKVVGGGIKKDPDEVSVNVEQLAQHKPKSNVELSSLHDYLDFMLDSRGYVTCKYSASELGYIKTPTPLQVASFSTAVCSVNKAGDADRLKSILECGLSANPMNKFGDSPFFIACKRGVTEIVQVYIECGARVDVADSLGRTPLHHVAWANPPNFEAAKLILTADPRLLYVTDQHGKTPLDFVPKGYSGDWMKFIDSMADSLFQVATGKQFHPEPSKGPILDPSNALSIKLAEGLASGMIKPGEVAKMPP